MKKIFLSLFVIGVVAVATFGITRAYFSDTEEILGNTVETGTIRIEPGTANSLNAVTFTNIQPGDDRQKVVRLVNDGSLDIGSLLVTAHNLQGDVELLENITVAVSNNVAGQGIGRFTPSYWVGQPINPHLTNSVDVLGPSVAGPAPGVMAPGEESRIVIWFRVPTTMGNDFQGMSATFDLEFFAEQVR